MKKLFLAPAALAVMAAMSMSAFGGTWRQGAAPNEALWWYDYDNGTYASNGWYWIDGNRDGLKECYYFNQTSGANGLPLGAMLRNVTTPDGYTVNANGEWVVNGVVQTR